MNLENPTPDSEANYDWILLEMYDQTVRNYSGGEMAKFITQPILINEEYVFSRTGPLLKPMRDKLKQNTQVKDPRSAFRKSLSKLKNSVKEKVKYLASTPASRLGAFRLSGEVHMWMYDRYSLGRLLKNCGFTDVKVKNYYDSDIPKWREYELDIKDGIVLDHISLFMEGKKP